MRLFPRKESTPYGCIEYYVDENLVRQGRFAQVNIESVTIAQGYYKNGKWHGRMDMPSSTRYYVEGTDITDAIKEIVDDIYQPTEEEKLLIKLRWDLDL